MSKYRYFIAHFEKCWFCPYIVLYFYYVFLFLEDSGASTTDEDRGQITIGYQPSLEQIALLTSEGHMTTDHVIKDVKTLAKNSSELVRQLQLCLVESVKEGLNNDVWSHIENVNNNFKNMYFSWKENLLGFSIFFRKNNIRCNNFIIQLLISQKIWKSKLFSRKNSRYLWFLFLLLNFYYIYS